MSLINLLLPLQPKGYSGTSILEAMKMVAQQAERAGTIIHHMKNFIRKGELLHETLSINELISSLNPLINHETRNTLVKIHYEMSDGLPMINVDKIQIEQVILNLVRNAVEAMVEAKTQNPLLIIKTSKINQQTIMVSIADNGPGLTKDNIDFIFNPYVSTKLNGM